MLAGPVLPGLVDAHSHAFQRAFAGLAERRDSEQDDFWSWRDRMYRVALRITPEQLRAVAAQLYAELLRGGYTQVCEFHYLQHDRDGRPYADPLALSWALADAAADAGIGLTMLPVLYERAGFAQPALRDDQRRFATDAAGVLALQRGLAAQRPAAAERRRGDPFAARGGAGIDPRSWSERLGDVPIHIHVAEQTAEVDDCLQATGRARSNGWRDHAGLDARWQLVHATHATPRGDRRGGAQRRRRGDLPVHRRQPRRRPGRPAGLAGRPACRWPSARTATSLAPGPKSCAGSNTASACCTASATSARRRPQGEPATAARLFGRALRAGGTRRGLRVAGG